MDGSVSALARTAGPQEMFTLQPHEDGEYRVRVSTEITPNTSNLLFSLLFLFSANQS
jgi:hypothetical protein